MNFKTTLILIILLSIITPVSIFIIQKDPQQEIERKRTFLYTIPEEEIIIPTYDIEKKTAEKIENDDGIEVFFTDTNTNTSSTTTSSSKAIGFFELLSAIISPRI